MFWNEEVRPDEARVPDDIVDVRFSIDCKRIPVDHAYALSIALQEALPWLAEEPGIALHTIHVAGSQNGWERPAHDAESELLVSRRTKLTIRAPRHRVADLLGELPGVRLELGKYPLTLGGGKIKPLSKETTLLARHLVMDTEGDSAQDEGRFLDAAARGLSAIGIRVRKALCGRRLGLTTPSGALETRSLMLAGLTLDESIRLQQRGLGSHRLMGCGVFIAHKGVDPVEKG